MAEFPKVAKTVLARGFAESHKLCAWQRRPYQTCLPINKRLKQATLRRMVLKQLVTDAHAPVTNFKHCESDWLLHKLLTSMFWMVAMVPPVLVITPVHAGATTHILPSAIATISMPKHHSRLVC